MKTIPIQRLLPLSPKAVPAPQLPPVPRQLLDEADELINVHFNGPGSLTEHLASAYAFLEKVNREHVARFTPCRKGCSHCCRADVQLTSFEAAYIALATGIPLAPAQPLTTGHRGACPFLSSAGTCTIYAARPLFCRTYHVLGDPALCAIPGAEVAMYATHAGDMSNILYRGMATWIHFQNRHLAGEMKDIRDFFPAARQSAGIAIGG